MILALKRAGLCTGPMPSRYLVDLLQPPGYGLHQRLQRHRVYKLFLLLTYENSSNLIISIPIDLKYSGDLPRHTPFKKVDPASDH